MRHSLQKENKTTLGCERGKRLEGINYFQDLAMRCVLTRKHSRENRFGELGQNGREVGRAGGWAGVGGKGRELYLNNKKIREKKKEVGFHLSQVRFVSIRGPGNY